jgi:hypothetical protein
MIESNVKESVENTLKYVRSIENLAQKVSISISIILG